MCGVDQIIKTSVINAPKKWKNNSKLNYLKD